MRGLYWDQVWFWDYWAWNTWRCEVSNHSTSQLCEDIIDIFVGLSRALKVGHSLILSKSHCFLLTHLSLTVQIWLSPNKNLDWTLIVELLHLRKPVLDIIECISISEIKRKNNSLRSFVVCRGDGSKLLLTCGVPHLQLHLAALVVNIPDLEVHTYSCEECILVGLVSISKKKAGFPNGRVSDKDNLEDIVVLGKGHLVEWFRNQKRNYSIPLLNIGINKNLTDFKPDQVWS